MPTEDLIAGDEQLLEAPRPESGRAGVLAGLAFLVALAALALTALLWWQANESETGSGDELAQQLDSLARASERSGQSLAQLAQRLDQVEAASGAADSSTELADEVTRLTEANRALAQQLDSQQAYTTGLQQAIESLQARLLAAESNIAAAAPARTDLPASLDLAGVEYLLRLAPERLALFYDLDAADQALAMADARLDALNNPLHIGLRQHIAEARRTLAGFDLPNAVEISATIDSLQQTVSSLVFAGEAGSPDQAKSAEGAADPGWWARLKASLASLVTVRRSAAGDVSRLSLEDKDMLRQGLWMQLEEARLALARHDPVAWQAALERAGHVLERWFEPSNPAFASMQDGLAGLAAADIAPAVPDISGPWTQLQLLRRAQPITAAPPAPVPRDPQPSPDAARTEPEGDRSETEPVVEEAEGTEQAEIEEPEVQQPGEAVEDAATPEEQAEEDS